MATRSASAKPRTQANKPLRLGRGSILVSGKTRSTFATSFSRTTSRMKGTNHFSRPQPNAPRRSGTR